MNKFSTSNYTISWIKRLHYYTKDCKAVFLLSLFSWRRIIKRLTPRSACVECLIVQSHNSKQTLTNLFIILQHSVIRHSLWKLCIFLLHDFFRSQLCVWYPVILLVGTCELQMKDLVSFMVILSVFTVAFGIAQHAIMYPNEPMSGVLVYRMLRLPYWQMYGELFLEDLEG